MTPPTTDHVEAAVAYQKYLKGDPLSAREVQTGKRELLHAAAFLRVMGPEFALVTRELARVGYEFERIQEDRKDHR